MSTSLANIWWVTCLRRAGENYYDDHDERVEEIDPSALVALTKR